MRSNCYLDPLHPTHPRPMYLERLLQINMATLAALGALLLGMGQRSEGRRCWWRWRPWSPFG